MATVTPKKTAGRPKIEISPNEWQDIERMMLANSSGQSIADKLRISYDTLSKRVIERFNCSNFADILHQKKETGNDLLKQRAFELALSNDPGSVPTLIFLLKARAGYSDKHDQFENEPPATVVMVD